MSASYCFVLHGRCIAPRVRDSIFAEHQRPQVAAFMECVDFMQPRWPSRISTFDSIVCRSFSLWHKGIRGGISYETLAPENIVTRGGGIPLDRGHGPQTPGKRAWRRCPRSRLLARNDFRVARDLGVVERMLPSQVCAAIFTVGLPRPRCTEDTGYGC
jgi:hypothetical protein